ncbi:hypothetical protein [Streptomyces sp. NBC_00338]|uniref:hypothetical protein n=1 Tax=Streptomyces sp. NBC_00338 TaxID=2975715 RepID=UPI0022592524|nr:hypothetical protein [Streptomyces sp. NBC_00338]MCX5138352.1 hypothetical protein [Streptomyces sp. NBC_00338]MCX5145141.1 hypothetical protein [Streptomyces sp. NBC_00338]
MNIQDDWRSGSFGLDIDRMVQQQIVRTNHIPNQPGALSGDMTVEALPTWYGGTTFRSALEASWAATLDTLRIVWEYEPETVTLPSGATYIPDFKLPEIGAWLEVKGTGVPRVEKAVEFGKTLACDCEMYACTCDWPGGELVIIGHPPKPYDAWSDPRFADAENINYQAMAANRRRHGGHPNWSSTRNGPLWLTRCSDCNRGTWFESSQCRACRGSLAGCQGYQTGASELEFRRITGPVPAGDDDGEAA